MDSELPISVVDRTTSESESAVRLSQAIADAHRMLGSSSTPSLPPGTKGLDPLNGPRSEQEQAAFDLEADRVLRLYEATPAMLHSIDAQGRLVAVSDLWLERLGYGRKQVLGRPISEFLTVQSREAAELFVRPMFYETEHLKELECQLVGSGGEVVEVLVSCLLERDADGHPLYVVSVIEDVMRKRRELHELRRSHKFLERISRLAGVGGWDLDLVTGAMSWSAETYRLHEREPNYQPTLEEELNFYAPSARPMLIAAIEKAKTDGDGWDLELPALRHDGRRLWMRVAGTVVFAAEKPVAVIGVLQDITARVASQRALQEANARVTLAANSGGIGIWDWDVVNNIMLWDPWMYRLYGMDPQGGVWASYDTWAEFLHPDDRAATRQAVQDGLDGIKPYDANFRIIWKDGSIHNIRGAGQVSRDEGGRVVRMVGTNWDTTEFHRLTSELAEHHELLRVTLQSIGEGVITTDGDGNVEWLNPVAEKLTGWTTSEAAGQPLIEVFHILREETREPAELLLSARSNSGEAIGLAGPVLLIARDGSEFGIEAVGSPIRNDRGNMFGLVLAFHDVTEQRRLAAETERIRKLELQLKDDFLSHVSHELRSPLTSIYSFGTIIADGLAGNISDQQDEYLQIILRNVRQLQSMIEDLLEVTHAKTGKLSLELQCFSAGDALLDAFHTLQGAAKTKGISLSFDPPPSLPWAFADPTRLRQVLIILLDNAIKFTPPAGTVTIKVDVFKSDPGFLLVEVSDSGCGISADMTDRIFEHLYQVTDPGLAGRKGLGLGLHIASQLVTRQGGTIWVTSEPHQGSRFFFTVPIFSLADLIRPVLAYPRSPGEALGVLAVEVYSRDHSIEVPPEISNHARQLLQRSVRQGTDVLVPIIDWATERKVFFVVCYAQEHGVDAFTRRIQTLFRNCEELQPADFAVAVSYRFLKLAMGEKNESTESFTAQVAGEVEAFMKSICLQRTEPI